MKNWSTEKAAKGERCGRVNDQREPKFWRNYSTSDLKSTEHIGRSQYAPLAHTEKPF